MNIDDLRSELAGRSTERARVPHADRMAGIRRKRAAARRAQVAGVAGLSAAVAIGVLVMVPSGVDTTAPDPAIDPTPSDTTPSKPAPKPDPLAAARVPVVDVDGVDFYETPGQLALDGAGVGEPGQISVRFSFTATGDVYEWDNVCRGEDGAYDGDPSPYRADTFVNGRRLGLLKSCEGQPDPGYVAKPFTSRSAAQWEALGVRAGERVEVEVRLIADDGSPIEGTDIRVGAAFWASDGVERVEAVPGVRVDRFAEGGGVNYEFARAVSATLEPGSTLTAPEVPGPGSRLVRFRVGGESEATLLGGRGGPQGFGNSARSGYTASTVVSLRAEDELRVQLDRSPGPQDVWIAVYSPAL